MTAKKDVVVAITSGTFVIGLLLNALTFNRAALVLGGTNVLSVVPDGLWIRLHIRDQDEPKHYISRPGYTSQSLLQDQRAWKVIILGGEGGICTINGPWGGIKRTVAERGVRGFL